MGKSIGNFTNEAAATFSDFSVVEGACSAQLTEPGDLYKWK